MLCSILCINVWMQAYFSIHVPGTAAHLQSDKWTQLSLYWCVDFPKSTRMCCINMRWNAVLNSQHIFWSLSLSTVSLPTTPAFTTQINVCTQEFLKRAPMSSKRRTTDPKVCWTEYKTHIQHTDIVAPTKFIVYCWERMRLQSKSSQNYEALWIVLRPAAW